MKTFNLSLASAMILFGGLSSASASNAFDYDDTVYEGSQLSLQGQVQPNQGELPKPDFSNLKPDVDAYAKVCPPAPKKQNKFVDSGDINPYTPTRRILFE